MASGAREHPIGALARERLDALTQEIARLERCRLRLELSDEAGGVDFGDRRDVVDRLLGIERRALAAGGLERVDDGGGKPEHAAFEHGEETDRARADDRHVDGDRLGGFLRFTRHGLWD